MIDDFREEANARMEQVRNFSAHAAESAGKRARETREFLSGLRKAIRLRKSQVTSVICEGKARVRSALRKISFRRPAPAVVPVFSSPDFIETLFQRSLDPKLHALL